MATEIYGASAVKRTRRSQTELKAIDDAIIGLLESWKPMTVRQIYYRLVSRGLAPKDDSGYRLTCRECLKLRRSGVVAYGDISDNTRWQRKPHTFRGMQAAMFDAIRTYRRSMWEQQDVLVEVWCEKDALAGVFMEVTDPFDVPLMVSRGFSSDTYLFEAAEWLQAQRKSIHIIVMTDYDAAGLGIATDVAKKLPAFLPRGWDIQVERLAVTEAQIDSMGLLTREPKPKDVKAGMTRCVELDAIEPAVLNELLTDAIVQHLDADEWIRTKRIEAQEKATLIQLSERLPSLLGDLDVA